VIAQFGGRREDFPQGFDFLVGLEKRLARLRVEKPAIHQLLQLLVGAALVLDVEEVALRLLDAAKKILEQEV